METLETSKNQTRRERDKKIYIDREILFNGLTLILNCFEGTEFEFKKNIQAKTRYLQHSHEYTGHSTIIYKILLGSEVVLKDEQYGYTMENNSALCTDKQINLDFAEIVELLEPLYVRYPYLKGIVDKMRIAILLDGPISELDMLTLAREYITVGEGMMDVTEYLESMKSHNATEILDTLDRRIEFKRKQDSQQDKE